MLLSLAMARLTRLKIIDVHLDVEPSRAQQIISQTFTVRELDMYAFEQLHRLLLRVETLRPKHVLWVA